MSLHPVESSQAGRRRAWHVIQANPLIQAGSSLEQRSRGSPARPGKQWGLWGLSGFPAAGAPWGDSGVSGVCRYCSTVLYYKERTKRKKAKIRVLEAPQGLSPNLIDDYRSQSKPGEGPE